MAKSKTPSLARRGFLKGAAVGAAAGAAALVAPAAAEAQEATQRTTALPPTAAQRAVENATPASVSVEDLQIVERPGADYMVDVFKSLGFEYLFATPGSSFRGIHESVINHGGNVNPEFITFTHEECSAAAANGYAKIEGKPALVCAHGTVGIQHAAMAIYNAYCDQAPLYVVAGNISDAAERRGRVEWLHAAQDVAATVRDYTKWDDNPASLTHFGESAVRAYQIAMTAPMMPVVLAADGVLQEGEAPKDFNWRIPKLPKISAPAGDSEAVAELAQMLVAAENPVFVTSRSARTPAGLKLLVELAEVTGAAVIDQQRRMNFPSRHPLNQTGRSRGAISNADLIVGLEVYDFFGVVHALGGQVEVVPRSIIKPGTKLVSISSSDLFYKSNYQNFQRYEDVDLSIPADAEATMPALIEAVKRLLTDDRKRAIQARADKLAQTSHQALEQTRTAASYAWDASPVSTARLSAELWAQIKNEDWSLVSDPFWVSNWPLRLWDFTKHYQFIGGAGGEGVGYLAPAALGAAIANKKHGRLSVSVQSDGDLMMANGVLWTAAHHRIPLLTVMHNNRAYHQEIMQLQRVANQHNRGVDVDKCKIGTEIANPNIDYTMLAKSMGVQAEGPISDPKDLSAAIRRGIDVVKRGDPYLIDVITQPR
ncbi:MAG TPA: thiamine pyrophosphate-dependent enzyme [Bryobacteraceae bacterium]|jgi:acetolactate synthase-1/2/3 large subunit|nr:thiamine pyrophosphate-dependent enzyme [Bryobacteraceae bacterium]